MYKMIVPVLLLILATGCEKEWNYKGGDENRMSLFITAYADSVITGTGFPVADVLNPNIYSNIDEAGGSIVNEASAYFTVNGNAPVELDKIYENNNYLRGEFIYDYPFSADDSISINIECNNYASVSSSVVMPGKPIVEAEFLGYEIDTEISGSSDSLMVIKIRVDDDKSRGNYWVLHAGSYRKAITVVKYNKLPDDLLQYVTQGKDTVFESYVNYNYFFSDDKMFSSSESISEPLFDDTLLDDSCEFIIKCRKCPSKLPEITDPVQIIHIKERYLAQQEHYVMIRLDELTEDYYKYLKYMENPELNRIPPSNIQGGYGVFGAVNRSRVIKLKFL